MAISNDNRDDVGVDAFSTSHNADAERAVLGCCLLDFSRYAQARGILKEQDFFIADMRRVFKTMDELARLNRECDPIAVADMAGLDLTTILELEAAVLSTQLVASHAYVVREHALRRELDKTLLAYHSEISNPSTQREIQDHVNAIERELAEIEKRAIRTPQQTTADVMAQILTDVEDGIENGAKHLMRTGVNAIDNLMGGIGNTDLCIIAANTSVGKTALALNITRNVAMYQRRPVVFFSLEQPKPEILQRLMAIHGAIPLAAIRYPRKGDGAWIDRMVDTSKAIATAPIEIISQGALTIAQLHGHLTSMPWKPGLIVVDYLQIMGTEAKANETREREVAKLSASLKAIAINHGVPIIALSQLNRTADRHHKPTMANLRDSGSLEQDADQVILLWRPQDGKTYTPDGYIDTEAVVDKNRNGQTGEARFWFDTRTLKCIDAEVEVI